MEIKSTEIDGLKLIIPNTYNDKRGIFIKTFNNDFFFKNNLKLNFQESFFSISKNNVIRGMHFQTFPFQNTKIVYISRGSILDVVLDLREQSMTYGKYFSIQLDDKIPIILLIPPGCAHGFLSLKNNTIVNYQQTSCFNSNCDKGINFNSFGMNWQISNPIISEKDINLPNFADVKFRFE